MSRSRIIAAVVAVLVVIAAIVWLMSRGHESTDDAQIDGHITQIAARVGGPIVKVAVDNNDKVDAGALLVQIDPRDYQVALDRAKAELADAEAQAAAARTGVPIAQVETRSGVSTASGAGSPRRQSRSPRHRRSHLSRPNSETGSLRSRSPAW